MTNISEKSFSYEESSEWRYEIWKIYGEHYITGKKIKIHESIFRKVLEQYVDYYEKV